MRQTVVHPTKTAGFEVHSTVAPHVVATTCRLGNSKHLVYIQVAGQDASFVLSQPEFCGSSVGRIGPECLAVIGVIKTEMMDHPWSSAGFYSNPQAESNPSLTKLSHWLQVSCLL